MIPLINSARPAVKNAQDELRNQVSNLRQQHRDLDEEIETTLQAGDADQINLQRLKKQKLHVKDQITTLENRLLPDIIA